MSESVEKVYLSGPKLHVDWYNWVVKPTCAFGVILALFWWMDIDKHLANYLSHLPGGFPFAFSPLYEFSFHRVPKVISGTVYIGMILLAICLLPWMRWMGKMLPEIWCNRIQFPAVIKFRTWLGRFPLGTVGSLWICILAIVFAAEMIGHLKRASNVYCPIRVQAFGGTEAVALADIHEPFPGFGEGGQCWPGGHSITGFLFLACFFGFMRLGLRRAAVVSLWIAFTYGNFLGLTQVYRGQHYLSHQLWSAYLVWMFSLSFFIGCDLSKRLFSKPESALNNLPKGLPDTTDH